MTDGGTPTRKKSSRADGQITGLAGEFFVAAELLKRGLQVSLTLGNAKAVDLIVTDPASGDTFTVQVKALRRPNYFPISLAKVNARHIYIFVILNAVDTPPTYYCLRGTTLIEQPERFEKWFVDPKFPGIRAAVLEPFRNRWDVFSGEK